MGVRCRFKGLTAWVRAYDLLMHNRSYIGIWAFYRGSKKIVVEINEKVKSIGTARTTNYYKDPLFLLPSKYRFVHQKCRNCHHKGDPNTYPNVL